MFENLFSTIGTGLSKAGSGLSSLFSGLFNGQQQQQPVMSGIPQPTVNAQTLSATPQNSKFLNLLSDLAGQYSQAERNQDLYNVLPADEAAQVINQQRLVGMKEDEVKQQNLQRQAISDILKNPSDASALARLEQIAAITGDPAAIEKYLVASGKGGSAPAVLQVADALLATLPPEQRTPEAYNQIIQMVGKYNEKGTTFDFYGAGGTGGYNPVAGATPGIASPVTPQAPQLPQGVTFHGGEVQPPAGGYLQMLEPPMLDGTANATRTVPQAPQMPRGGVMPLPGAIESAALREGRIADAKRQAEANVDLATKPDIARATELATNEGKSEAELKATMAKKARDARNVIGLADEADKILKNATSGKIDQAISASTKGLGVSTEATRADARLKVISAALTSNVPRFEGPQGVLDVELYRQAAGDVANSDLPWQDRQAALQTIRDLQSKYLPENQGSDSGSPRGGKTGNPVIDKYLE